jgi:hypothetical protein
VEIDIDIREEQTVQTSLGRFCHLQPHLNFKLITICKMKRVTQSALADGRIATRCYSQSQNSLVASQRWRNSTSNQGITSTARTELSRCLHTTSLKGATVAPLVASGPPPKAPVPSAEHVDSRVARRRKQAELLKRGQDLRAVAGGKGGGTAKQKRFWKDVHVKHADGML